MDASTERIITTVLVGAVASIITGVIAYFGGRGASIAAVQTALNASFKELVDTLQQERAADRKRMLEIEGRCNGLEQHIVSLERILRGAGIEVPPRPLTQTVFVFDSQNDPKAAN